MKEKDIQKLDTVLVGSGLAAISFINSFDKKKKLSVISPDFYKSVIKEEKYDYLTKNLPSQMNYNNSYKVDNYFNLNDLKVESGCRVLGSLETGGLSKYWGLQMDTDLNDLHVFKVKIKNLIIKNFINLINYFNLSGIVKINGKITYSNDYTVSEQLETLLKKSHKDFHVQKPLLAFIGNKNKKLRQLSEINENKDKLNSVNYLNFLKGNIHFINYVVKRIYKKNSKLYLVCEDSNKTIKIYNIRRIVFAAGTIATTKLILDYLKIEKEVKIKHHVRSISVFLSRKKILNPLKFTPSLVQIKSKDKKNQYSGDIRPGNNLIIKSILEISWLFYFAKRIITFFKDYIIFSNILLDSKFSNLYIKKISKQGKFQIYKKEKNIKFFLKTAQKNIYNFLLLNKIIFPFLYINYFPGIGADYHYFGTIPMSDKKNKLSVNMNCELKDHKNIFIIDGSVFDFKYNKYPLGIVMANAARIAKYLSK